MAYDESTVLVGKDGKLFINEYDLSGWVNTYTSSDQVQVLDASGWGNWKHYKPGQRFLTIEFTALYTSDSDGPRAVAKELSSSEAVKIIVVPGASSVGSLALQAQGFIHASEPQVVATDVIRMTLRMTPSNVFGINSHVLHLGSETASFTGTTVDAGADRAGTLGALCQLSVYQWTELTSLALTVQHSTNGSSWSTLTTMTTATGLTSERKVITGDVYRYRRVIGTIVGTGSCAFVLTCGELPAAA